MTNDDLKLIFLQLKIGKENGPPFFLPEFILHILHISWRGSHTQIQTMPSTVLGDGEFLFASLRHLVTLIDRLTQAMCIWRVSPIEGILGKHKCHLSPQKGEYLLTHRELFQERYGHSKNRHAFQITGSLNESEFQTHYFSK